MTITYNVCITFNRVPEAILIAMVTTLSIYIASVVLGTCIQFSQDDHDLGPFTNESRDYLCPKSEYYNDMATLMFNPQERIIKQLFHWNGTET